jgi:hypothetical protein
MALFFIKREPSSTPTPVGIWAFGITLFVLFPGKTYSFALSAWTETEFWEKLGDDLVAVIAPSDGIETIFSLMGSQVIRLRLRPRIGWNRRPRIE